MSFPRGHLQADSRLTYCHSKQIHLPLQLPGGCHGVAMGLPGGCLVAAWWLPGGCLVAAWWLPWGCLEGPGGCLGLPGVAWWLLEV